MLDLKLEAYAKSDIYPFHMPGHKRKPLPMPNPYTIDITEIDGFDDLHHPTGVLKEAAQRAARLYGAKKSYYLVNGSTCGILAAVSAAVPQGGKLLMARNAHKSAYHAAYLRNLSTVYLNLGQTKFGILGAVDPKEVREHLQADLKIRAVLITSPTYEGVVSDVAAIAEIAHEYGIPLIVDEAHGAHFGFHEAFPVSAVRLGADVVVQSMHKVLPSFTQTALLHLNSGVVLPEKIEQYLDIYETSSPSYLFMAGMEKCLRLLEESGKTLFEAYVKRLLEFYERAGRLKHLRVMRKKDFPGDEVFDLDLSKIVISVQHTNSTGKELYRELLQRYRIQMELCTGFYALGMTSIMDDEDGFLRLNAALEAIDGNLLDADETGYGVMAARLYSPKEKQFEIHEAMAFPKKTVSFEEAVGHVSARMVSLYPPGIPILLPGETIDADFIKNIRGSAKMRLNLQGIADIINERIDIVNF